MDFIFLILKPYTNVHVHKYIYSVDVNCNFFIQYMYSKVYILYIYFLYLCINSEFMCICSVLNQNKYNIVLSLASMEIGKRSVSGYNCSARGVDYFIGMKVLSRCTVTIVNKVGALNCEGVCKISAKN